MAGPQDIAAQLNSQMNLLNSQLNQFSMNVSKIVMEGMNTANNLAPHNVLASMTSGSGQFTAKTPTSKLQQSSIF